ncbi:sodium-coupled monocarboxylate transporter 1 isoform X3 [Vanacampus margaritifer]
MSVAPFVGASFAAADYVVFAFMLAVSAAIGVYYAWTDRALKSSDDFLTGGRRLTALPVSLSLTASFMSAITVLANPAEVYRYGASIVFYGLSYFMSMVVTSEVFLPVFYRLSITSIYEYLELRFSRATRLLGTLLFIVQTILYTGIVIYTPALALNQVTGMDLWSAVISTGVVCTFYCTMGGLKAVVWTDVFQVGVMLAGFLLVIIRCVVLKGGVGLIISDSRQGGRLDIWDFDPKPQKRHTFWTVTFGGTFVWVSIYGINQAQVQRYISCKSITHAKLSLFINLIGLCCILLSSVFAGLCLYSVYKNCDPWTAGIVSAPDQLMPYLVMDILGDYPGLPGLFVAAAYSGSLSTVSSSINALAAVTVEDLIKPHMTVSDKKLSFISKVLSFLYGVLCIGMAGLASLMGGILQATISIFGIIGGPLLGLFSLGIICPFANSKGCNLTASDSFNRTSTGLPAHMSNIATSPAQPDHDRNLLADNWYSLSYLYFSPIGTIITILVGLFISLVTGGWKRKVDSRLTLVKSDTTVFCIFKALKDRLMTGKPDVAQTKENHGNQNPAFCNIELDYMKCNTPT